MERVEIKKSTAICRFQNMAGRTTNTVDQGARLPLEDHE
jgi:hypothetical protein